MQSDDAGGITSAGWDEGNRETSAPFRVLRTPAEGLTITFIFTETCEWFFIQIKVRGFIL